MNGVYNGGAGGSHHEPDPALYAWAEVTGSFLASCQELQLGELLHDDMFGLFEVGFFQYCDSRKVVTVYIVSANNP
jgi:hypothetical protein